MVFSRSLQHFGRVFCVVVCLLLGTVDLARAQTTQPISIEVPLFEGGNGKDWYVFAARAYELQGDWQLSTAGDSKPLGRLRVELAPKGKESVDDVMLATLELNGVTVGQALTSAYKKPNSDYAYGWKWTSPSGAALEMSTDENGVLSGTLSHSDGRPPQRFVGHKAKPFHINMYLDPRIVDKVRVRLLEGTFFEITNAFINFWPSIHNGDVLQIDEAMAGPNWEGDSTWRESFMPGSLDQYTENGKTYGVPLGYYAYAFWINKKMFREHGWKNPRTWNEMFALCDEIKKANIAPLAFQGRYPDYAIALYDAAYYHIAGADAWKRRANLLPNTFNSPEGVQSIALIRQLAKNYFQAGAMGMSHTEAQLQFFLGNTAMIPCGSWLKSEMKGKIPDGFELGCFNLPTVENEKGDPTAVYVRVEPYFVMSRSGHPKEALDFLRFMTSRQMSGKFARMQDLPVAIRGANEGNLSHELDDLTAILNNAKSTFGTVPGEGYPEFAQTVIDQMYQTVAGNKSPQEVGDDFQRLANSTRSRSENPDKVTITHTGKALLLLGLLLVGAIFAFGSTLRGFRKASRASIGGLQRMRLRNVLIFVAPSVLIYSLFVIIPSVRSFNWSLHQWNGLTHMNEMPWKGLLNFKRLLFESDAFWTAIKNNLFLMFVIPSFVIPLSLLFATCISRGVWGAKVFRVVFFFPNLLGGVAATLLWLHVYNPQGGLMNSALTLIGLNSFAGYAWLEPGNLYWALVPIGIWGGVGFNMVLYLAAMETVPESLYESARLDGASQLRQFWSITLPLIWDILAISIVFMVIGGMKAFEIIWLLTNQRPPTQNHVIGTLMVQTMFNDFKVGEATAIAVMLFLMVFIGTAATLKVMKRDTVEM